jgi:hypothetical protein
MRERSYVFRVSDDRTGEYYIGLRSVRAENLRNDHDYFGSGNWVRQARRDGRMLTKVVIAVYSTRRLAGAAEKALIAYCSEDPLCRNVTGIYHHGKAVVPAVLSTSIM